MRVKILFVTTVLVSGMLAGVAASDPPCDPCATGFTCVEDNDWKYCLENTFVCYCRNQTPPLLPICFEGPILDRLEFTPYRDTVGTVGCGSADDCGRCAKYESRDCSNVLKCRNISDPEDPFCSLTTEPGCSTYNDFTLTLLRYWYSEPTCCPSNPD